MQRDIAVRVGADETSVWNWETGRNEPELKFIPAIIAFLGSDPLPVPRTIAGHLVRYREARGWSQKRLAHELAVDPTTLSRWELGKKQLYGPFLRRVNALLGSSWERLVPKVGK